MSCLEATICNTRMVTWWLSQIRSTNLVTGISASTGLPFSPPRAFRTIARPNPGKKEKATTRQGKCHKCLKWIPIEGIKDMETKVRFACAASYFFWTFHSTGQRNILVRDDYRIIGLFNDEIQCRWKHAASCHHGSSARNDDVYEKDKVYYKLVSLFK